MAQNAFVGDAGLKDRICIALDVATSDEALRFARLLADEVGWFKIGSQLFGAAGPDIVTEIKATGARVFLDLKYHDIPNTVAAAVNSCSRLGVDMINVHAMGGLAMMRAAAEAAKVNNGHGPMVIAVTLLTSMDQQVLAEELRVGTWVGAYVTHLTRMAKFAGLDGVVASGQEAARIRLEFGQDLVIVTPGIRPHAAKDDQKRTLTPSLAIKQGASILVIGRPVLEADDPKAAVREILRDMQETIDDEV